MGSFSISSFRHRYGRLLLLIVLWFALLELVFRIPFVAQRFASFEHETFWYSPYVPDRIALIQSNPKADIWYIGASLVMQGMNPAEIDPLIQPQSAHHQSLNVALPGLADIGYLENYLTEVFLPLAQPKTAVMGIYPYLYAYSTIDYDRLGGIDVQTRNDTDQLDHQIGHWLTQNLALYRFINTLNYAFFQAKAEEVMTDETGFLSTDGSILDNPSWLHVIEPSGDGNTRLEMNLERIQHLRDILAGRGIHLMILNFPISDTLIETYPGGKEKFDEYLRRVSEFTDAQAIPYCDLHHPFQVQYATERVGYFHDYYHLNSRGAAAVAPMIATFLSQNLDAPSPVSNQCASGAG